FLVLSPILHVCTRKYTLLCLYAANHLPSDLKWSRLLSRLPFGLDSVLAPLPFSFCQLSTVRSFSLKESGGYGASSSLLTGFPSYVVQSQYWLKDKRPTCGPT
ncbi:hypothetical protein AMECASPLE_031471, partial [Ameca splendens]